VTGPRSDADLLVGRDVVRVRGIPAGWDDYVAPRYAPLAAPVDTTRTPLLEVVCREGPERVVVELPPPGETPVLEVSARGEGRYGIRSHWSDAELDLGARRCALTLTTRRERFLDMSLENTLRIATQLSLLEERSMLFHGAGVIDGEAVVLLFGPSGAGKSTATGFSVPRAAVSDDMVVLDLSGKRRRGPYPLAAACRLRQAHEDRLATLSSARAVATLSASVPYVHELGVRHAGLTALVARLAASVPVFDLHFTKSPRFWELLRERFGPPPS
jgi:hypothetical protein